MQAGLERKINASVILFLVGASISSANILTDVPKSNPLNIDWDPAPSPEDGPPLSAGASRDKSLLPAQIGGILGAYLVSVCIIGIALILVGRKLRLQIQKSTKNLDIEMVQPHFNNVYGFDPSPVSPGGVPGGPRNFSWPSPEKDIRNPYIFPAVATGRSPTSPAGISETNIDNRVVEADREMLQRDLEDIYAHVMEQEEAKAAGVPVAEMPPPPQLQARGAAPHGAPQRQISSPRKIEKNRPANLNVEEPKSPKSTKSRASSIISSLKSPRKSKGVRGMQISSPIPTPLSATFPSNHSDEEPLSPRYYTPPPPPPVPTDQVPYTHSRKSSNVSPISPTRSIAEQLSTHSRQPHHRPTLSQTSVQSYSQRDRDSHDPISAVSATSQTPLYISVPKIKPMSPQHPTSTNSSSRALPFRQFEPALQSPSFTSVKTTVLERTTPVGGLAPPTGGLKTPWSAGAVPYSPYQPFTPMMPITPRLVTKEERKAKKKAMGRGPVTELVGSSDELWDSGY